MSEVPRQPQPEPDVERKHNEPPWRYVPADPPEQPENPNDSPAQNES